jgi:hypothetical protein
MKRPIKDRAGSVVYILRKTFITIVMVLLAFPVVTYAAGGTLSHWITLSSDDRDTVREIIRSEVDQREGYSSAQEEKANLNAVEGDKFRDDSTYKSGIITANKVFIQTKKQRDDLTSQFQAASSELEEYYKNIKNIKAGIENSDSQTARYEQDIKTQQDSLKKWLQTEKQGEVLVAVIYTRGFKDKAHALETLADQASAPLMAQHMGTYIQSFTKVINDAVAMDFIRAVDEGTAKWNNEEPYIVELDKGEKGTTYLRMKRYELYPFQEPKGGRIKPPAAAGRLKASIITSKKDLESFLSQSPYSAKILESGRVAAMIQETAQNNSIAEENLNEHVKSFRERIAALQEKIGTSRAERGSQVNLLKMRDERYGKMAQDVDALRSKWESTEKAFQEAQATLQEKKRVHESIIIKTALVTTRGSQSPAEASAEVIIDKLAEVKNDARVQHSSTTTEVTNFQLTDESSVQAVTDARIIALRLISFINEGESVRVNMAFRVRTVLEDHLAGMPQRVATTPAKIPVAETKRPAVKHDKSTKVAKGGKGERPPKQELSAIAPTASEPPPARKGYPVLAAVEIKDCLFELKSATLTGNEIHILIEITNREKEATRYIALYDVNYRWTKSTIADEGGKTYDVSEVFFLQDDKKTSMYEVGKNGIEIGAQGSVTAKLIFKNVPTTMRSVTKLNLHPFVYFRRSLAGGFGIGKGIGYTWEEGNLPMSGIRLTR